MKVASFRLTVLNYIRRPKNQDKFALTRTRKVSFLNSLLAVLVSMTLVVGGCASKASEAECQEACGNIVTIGLAEVDSRIAKDPDVEAAGETGRELIRKQAEALFTSIKTSCLDECGKRGTKAQTECLKAAKSAEDIGSCSK